jgi:ABC-2 type transport system ATP-binding protein
MTEIVPTVEVSGLVKRYRQVTAVDGIDLSVRAGECFGLLGPNGAGKTTTIESIVGLLAPTAGEVRVFGRAWGRDGREIRARMGVALQEARFPERLTVLEVVAQFRSFYPKGPSPRALIGQVGLTEKAGAWTVRLSGGQRQRLALACALAGDPDLLVLDEPTTGLDPQARLMIGDEVLAHRDRGRTILLSTHYMEEAERLCDRVAVVDRGKVIALGTPAALIATLGGEQVVAFELEGASPGEPALAALPAVRALRRAGAAWRASSSAGHETAAALFDLARRGGFSVTQLTIRRATLEDVYVSLTGRQLRDE